MSSFEGENMQTQYNVLNYGTELYFHDYKLAIEIDENGHSGRYIDYEIKRQKEIEQELGCISLLELILTKKTLIFLELSMKYLDILNILLRLGFKSDKITKSKAINFIVKKILPDYK